MSRWRLFIAALVAAIAALSLPHPSTAAASDLRHHRVRPPEQLWKTFPLVHPRQRVAPNRETPSRSEIRSRQPLVDGHDRGRNGLWILVGAGLAMAAAAAAITLSKIRRRGGQMDRFRLTGKDRTAEETSGEQPELLRREQPAGALKVGDHISSVLSAAEEAAVRIHQEARQSAELLQQEAQERAASCVEAAHREAEATRAEAERLRSEADEWSRAARAAAEEEAVSRRAEAEAEARRILTEADREAASMSFEAERRHEALKTDIKLAEDRLRQLSTGLQKLAARLDSLLSASVEAEDDVPARRDQLLDALGPSRELEEAMS
jgi:hypothetical protein